MVLGAQLWPLSAIFDLRRLAARTRREHGNDVVCPLLLTSEINERSSLPVDDDTPVDDNSPDDSVYANASPALAG